MSSFIKLSVDGDDGDDDECNRYVFVNISQIETARLTVAGPNDAVLDIVLIGDDGDDETITIYNREAVDAARMLYEPELVAYDEMQQHLRDLASDARRYKLAKDEGYEGCQCN